MTVPPSPLLKTHSNRNMLVSIGLVCIILAVSLFGVIAFYSSMIDRYRTSSVSQEYQMNLLMTQVATKDAQILSLTRENAELEDIANLMSSTVWVDSQTINQPAGSYSHWIMTAYYSGYVSVWVQTSTTTNTYARLIYTSFGVRFDQQINVGTNGTAVFPVLLCQTIEIRVGNTNILGDATETVTIVDHY